MVPDFEQKGAEGRIIKAEDVDETLKTGVRYFGNRICPFAHRAWWAAKETGFEMDYIHINLKDTKPTWYPEKVNPAGTVPTLYVDSKPIFESAIVAEYISEVSGNKLWPSDPVLRANARYMVARFGEKVLANLYKFLGTENEEFWTALKTGLEGIEAEYAKLKAEGGPYFNGSEISLVEIFIFPFIYRFDILLPHYTGKQLSEIAIPGLLAAFEAAKERPAFQATILPVDDVITAYSGYAKKK